MILDPKKLSLDHELVEMVFGIDFKYFDWQNSFAPNDSYVHISRTELTEEEIEAEKQNIGKVKKVGLTDDAYQECCRH